MDEQLLSPPQADLHQDLPDVCDETDAKCIAEYLAICGSKKGEHRRQASDVVFRVCDWSAARCASLHRGALALGLHELADIVEEVAEELVHARKITAAQVLAAFPGATFVPTMFANVIGRVHPPFPLEAVLEHLRRSQMLLLMHAKPGAIAFGDVTSRTRALILVNNDLIDGGGPSAQGLAPPHVARLQKWRELWPSPAALKGTCTVYLMSNAATFTMGKPETWLTESTVPVPTEVPYAWLMEDSHVATMQSEWQVPIDEYALMLEHPDLVRHQMTPVNLQRMIGCWATDTYLVISSTDPNTPVYSRGPEGPAAMREALDKVVGLY
jgi:hypothetical protein